MSERRFAKSGDMISAKAGAKLRKRFRGLFDSREACLVHPKSEGDGGQWLCIDCGEVFANNLEASSHPKSHRLAWRSFTSGKLEVP